MQLDQRVALITGAGSGIGKATCLRFAREGARIGALGHAPDEINQTADEIRHSGGHAIALIADVSNAAQMHDAMEQLAQRWGRIDIVFANAGINGVWAPIDQLEPDEWDKTLDTNLKGTFLTIKYAVPHLKKRGGSIIVTSSINGTRVFSNTGATAYSCSKAAQVAMTKMLALELAPFDIRVNVICPGSVETSINRSTVLRDLDKVQIKVHIERRIPLTNKPATSDEIAETALFLASDASKHITGTPIWIDGGESLIQG